MPCSWGLNVTQGRWMDDRQLTRALTSRGYAEEPTGFSLDLAAFSLCPVVQVDRPGRLIRDFDRKAEEKERMVGTWNRKCRETGCDEIRFLPLSKSLPGLRPVWMKLSSQGRW